MTGCRRLAEEVKRGLEQLSLYHALSRYDWFRARNLNQHFYCRQPVPAVGASAAQGGDVQHLGSQDRRGFHHRDL